VLYVYTILRRPFVVFYCVRMPQLKIN